MYHHALLTRRQCGGCGGGRRARDFQFCRVNNFAARGGGSGHHDRSHLPGSGARSPGGNGAAAGARRSGGLETFRRAFRVIVLLRLNCKQSQHSQLRHFRNEHPYKPVI